MSDVKFPEFDYYLDDDEYVSNLLKKDLFSGNIKEIKRVAADLVHDIRDQKGGIGSINDLLYYYGLDTQEGLSLMALAEALLRIPDKQTANDLITSKLQQIDKEKLPEDKRPLIKAMVWGMGIAQKIVGASDNPDNFIKAAIGKLGMPTVRNATYQIIKMMSHHFILGETIEKATKQDKDLDNVCYSYDMLGEGARTLSKAKEYFDLYYKAIEHVSNFNQDASTFKSQSVSIKISALHPKFMPQFQDLYFDDVYDVLLTLVRLAFDKKVPITIDAEEANRLEFTIALFDKLRTEKEFSGWGGLGIVIQAYQKRALKVIDYVIDLAKNTSHIIPIRLVKGAYWDSEIKHAQENGLEDFPVFTRKAATDLHYLHCAKALFDNRDYVYPQIATHNALTIAQLISLAGNVNGWEIQRLYGMGETLFESVSKSFPELNQRIYAPVGEYANLLSYLVRRLLENGANSSFIHAVHKKDIPLEDFLKLPRHHLEDKPSMRHQEVRLPKDIFSTHIQSKGFELGYQKDYKKLCAIAKNRPFYPDPIITEFSDVTLLQDLISPTDGQNFGKIALSNKELAEKAIDISHSFFHTDWQSYSVRDRADIFLKAADLMEQRFDHLIPLLIYEAGKTIEDAIADIREAIDFCRYYAFQALDKFEHPIRLDSVNGEYNSYFHAPRGVFACISPWNFPCAIFLGQISAALLAGNCVIAKPAEPTPLIANEIVQILYEAGLPKAALSLVLGSGDIGEAITTHPKIAGIVFTGSTKVAQNIYKNMANLNQEIKPFIAETGGLNAMIIDATALHEQVTDDVLMSAFHSSGQRCSALRLLLVQEEITDSLMDMIAEAATQMVMGHPEDIATQMGAIISENAKDNLMDYLGKNIDNTLYRGDDLLSKTPDNGFYVPPSIIKLESLDDFDQEIFGPVLHILPYKKDDLDEILTQLNQKGYGLTLGVHSRIPEFVQYITHKMQVGNIYVNRNIIGAVVGAQPFGGYGKSGTGPKAGGPEYLTKFTYERVISTNIAAIGGDTELMSMIG